VHPATLAARLGAIPFEGLPKPERAIATRELGANRQPTPSDRGAVLAKIAHSRAHVGEATTPSALGCGSDDDQQALRVSSRRLHVNAVDPEVDVAFGREIALVQRACSSDQASLRRPMVEAEAAGLPAEQSIQRVLEVAGEMPLR